MAGLISVVSRRPILFLFGFTLIGVGFLFGDILIHPNQYLFSTGADGLKTYHAMTFHLLYGEGVWFEGFQYPDGNHIVYVDMHPLLLGILSLIQRFVNIAPYTIGIVNYSIIIGFFVCVWFVYQILRANLLPPAYAMLSTLIITFMSPQILRISGHYALAYIFFIPVLWYLLIRIYQNGKPAIWSGIYGVFVLLFGFAHPYYALLGVAFAYAFGLVHLIQGGWKRRSDYKIYFYSGLAGILPGIILRIWEIGTMQGLHDLVRFPYGFLTYIAGFETIFLPMHSPFLDVWNAVIRVRKIGMEGYAYVGFVGLVILLLTLIKAGRYLFKKRWKRIFRPVLPAHLRTAIWAGTLLLIPAMAYPFQWFPQWEDYFGFVRQFRSIGRLAWIFYYVYMVYASFFLYLIFRHYRKKNQTAIHAGTIILIAAFLSWGISAVILVRSQIPIQQHHISNFEERKIDFEKLLKDHGFQPADFQAIIALPFYHTGSEKLTWSDWEAERYSMALSLQTGLKIVNNFSARIALNTSLTTIQLASHPDIPKKFPQKLTDERPFLLIYLHNSHTPGGAFLIEQSKPISQHKKFSLGILNPDDLISTQADTWQEFHPLLHEINNKPDEYFASDSTAFVYVNSFGGQPTTFGDGTLPGDFKEVGLYRGKINGKPAHTEMEASFWVNLDIHSNYLPTVNVRYFNGEKQVDRKRYRAQFSQDVYKGWARIAVRFPLHDPGQTIQIDAKGRKLVFDNMLIRPVGVDVFSGLDSNKNFLLNNYLIEKP